MRQILVGSILLSTAIGSHAVTLGRHSGAAVLGRPLDVRVQALLAPGEDAGSLCIQSEVLYGDVAVSSGSVSTSLQRTAPDAQASVRVQVSQPVNEPIVTVVVKAGCASSFSRRFVLLADPVSEPLATGPGGNLVPGALPAITLPPLAAETRLAPRAERGGEDSPSPSVDGNASGTASAAPAIARKKPAVPRSRPASVVRKPAPEPTPPATPRLQLDPVDLSLAIERDPVLKLSLAMLSEPTDSEEERAAAGLLWKAINATPEDILRDSQKLAVLEAESKGLREQEKLNRDALSAMESQLDSSRYMTWLAYVFGALFLLALGALLWLSRRRKEEQAANDRGAWYAGVNKPARSARAAAASAGVLEQREEPQGVDIDLNLDGEYDDYQSLHDSSMSLIDGVSAEDSKGKTGGVNNGVSPSSVSRSVATEELFDVQQQADFFISLGEFEQAIGVLKDHLAESQDPGALAYLDLFRLYHQLGRQDEYEQLREEFNLQFNAGAPPFEEYSEDSKGLESYETAFGRIQALWPQPRVLDVIEKSIFKEPNDPDGEVFDLEAYRELLLLHAVAKEMINRELAELPEPLDFEHTAIKPLKAAAPRVTGSVFGAVTDVGQTVPQDEAPHASPRLGLDVDLDALSEMSAFEASLPEVPVAIEPSSKPAPKRGKVQEEGNLIDFEVLDFMPPDETEDDLDVEKKAE